MSRPRLLVTRRVFPEVLALLREHFEVEANERDDPWPPERLREQSQELVDWFFGARDPSWLPEHLLYEEVEEVVEELIPIREEEEYEYVEPSETYYEE